MTAIRVIGIGSPFGNDNLGWRVIERLKQAVAAANLPEPIALHAVDRPGVNLVHMFEGAEFVILVDAILDANKHGEIFKLESREIVAGHPCLSSHELDVTSAISLAATLRALPARLRIIGLGVDPHRAGSFGEEPIIKLAVTIVTELDEYMRRREAG